MPSSKILIESAAALPVRMVNEQVEVLLVRTKRKGLWGLPKGRIKIGETPVEAASREAAEEAGVYGDMHDDPFALYQPRRDGREQVAAVYLLFVNKAKRTRERDCKWFPLAAAHSAVAHNNRSPRQVAQLRAVLTAAAERLGAMPELRFAGADDFEVVRPR